LRQDVKFSDGQPLTAKDVAFTIKLSMTKAANINPINMIDYLKGGKAFYDGVSDTLPAVQTPDDYTVTIELEAPFASWDQIALTEMNILPAHIYETIKPEDLKDENAPHLVQTRNGAGLLSESPAGQQCHPDDDEENLHPGAPSQLYEALSYRQAGATGLGLRDRPQESLRHVDEWFVLPVEYLHADR
jgi:hypothetical protein